MSEKKQKKEKKMLQNFLDGKKKYSALILTLAAAVIPILVQDPETQKTILDVVPSASALIAGVFYIITQGKLDQAKEVVKLEVARAATNGTPATPAQPQGSTATPEGEPDAAAAIELPEPLDIALFHKTVLDEVKTTYKEANPATIYYKARDKGQLTKCQALQQATDYWNYLVDLAVDARDWLKEQTEKKAGTCGRSPEYYVFTRDFNSTIRTANALAQLVAQGTDWKTKIMPFQRTLFMVGVLSEQMMCS